MNFLNKQFIFFLVLALSVGMLLTIVTADSRVNIKQGEIFIGDSNNGSGFNVSNFNSSGNEIISKIYNTDFPFNAISFTWEDKENTDFEIYIRFKKEKWTSWEKLSKEVDLKDPNIDGNSTQLQFSPYTNILQYKFVFKDSKDFTKITNLKLIYIDSTKGAPSIVKIASEDNNDLHIISRKEWGADESYRFDAVGQEKWPIEYYVPKKFVLHHTASTNISDPAATVRAIYYWHSVTHGWGDIGYNYLIDAQGNIYEGRAGGDGAVGAHAYMQNRNTIGIAILGCYEPMQNNCNTPDNLTPQTKLAIEKLIATKSQLFNIDPTSSSNFNDQKNLPNVIGHKDVGQTNCPGELIYNQLSFVRSESKYKLAALPTLTNTKTSAQLISVSQNSINIPQNQLGQVIVKYKNTGEAVWRSYQDAGLILGTNVKRLGKIDSVKFASYNNNEIDGFRMQEGNVRPGDIGTFILNLPSSNNTYNYTLAWDNKGYFPQTDFTVKTLSIASTTSKASSTTPKVVPTALTYEALLRNYDMPSQIPLNSEGFGQLKYHNIGTATWEANQLKLKITLEDGTKSPLIKVTEVKIDTSIIPQQAVLFDIPFENVSQAGKYVHTISLMYNNQVLNTFRYDLETNSSYSAQITEQNFPIAIKNTWRPTIIFTLKNNGSENWINPTLKSTDIDGTLSWFFDSSWKDKKTIQTLKTIVKPGEEVTFKFKIKPYWKPGTYPHIYKLWSIDKAVKINGQENFERETRVDL